MNSTLRLFYIEVTDTFGGEANYSWVTRHVIRAKSERGAITALARRSGLNWRFDGTKYLSRSGATCAFIDMYDKGYHGELRIDSDDRKESEK